MKLRSDTPEGFEPTNAPLMVIPTDDGFFAIDPLDDTWIEGARVRNLWQGKNDIPVLRSRRADLEIWFVSLDWLVELYPDLSWLKTAQTTLRQIVKDRGFEIDA